MQTDSSQVQVAGPRKFAKSRLEAETQRIVKSREMVTVEGLGLN